MTVEEYLEFEEYSEVRHEYFDGKLKKIPENNDFHNEICFNFYIIFRKFFKKLNYKIYSENVKVELAKTKYTYPDVFITCAAEDLESRQIKRHPSVIVEVLSDSTRVYDKTDKFILYQKIPSLKHYITVEPEKPLVECYSVKKNGKWIVETFTNLSEKISLNSLKIELNMADIYEK